MEDRSISLERATLISILFFPALGLVTIIPALVAGRFGAPFVGGVKLADLGLKVLLVPVVFAIGFVAIIVIHEGLHALGFLLGGAPRDRIHFGIHRPTMSPFAGCRVPLGAGAYRLSIALPAIVLGLLPWVLGMFYGSAELIVFAFFMLWFASGNMIILWLIRDVPSKTPVMDHPERAGCHILAS